jgi:hypothetical protein
VVGHEASERESKSFRNVRTSGDCCLVALKCGLKTSGVGPGGLDRDPRPVGEPERCRERESCPAR